MLNVFLGMDKKYNCKDIGCGEEFQYMIQLIRHIIEYNKIKPVAKEKNRYYYKQDELYRCTRCNTNYKHVQNISRHKCSFPKQQFNSSECGKVFKFKSRLTTHKKVHKKSLDQTRKKGSTVFLRKYYFDAHLKYCTGYSNDEFDSSSQRSSFLVVSLVIDPPGQPTFES